MTGVGFHRGSSLAAALVWVAALMGSCSTGGASSSMSGQPSARITAPAADTGGPAAPRTDEPAADMRTSVALGFGRAFTATTLGQRAWFAALSTWLTDEQAALYRDVPIDDIPVGRLVDVEVDEAPGRVARGLLTYDTGMILDVALEYVDSRDSWLVVSIVPVQPGDRPSG